MTLDDISQEVIVKLTREEGDFIDDYCINRDFILAECVFIRNRLQEEKTGVILDSLYCKIGDHGWAVLGAVPLKAIKKTNLINCTIFNTDGRVMYQGTHSIDAPSFEFFFFFDNKHVLMPDQPFFIKVIPIKKFR